MPIEQLTELSKLSNARLPSETAIRQALAVLRDALSAEDVFLIYGDGSGFRSFSTGPALELTDVALWIINRDLTSRTEPNAFDENNGHVDGFRDASSRRRCHRAAALIPMATSTGEMALARGNWPRGLGTSRLDVLQAALPALALLAERALDSSRAERLRQQFGAMASITRAMSESEDMEAVLTAVAGEISTVTGIDYISIDLLGSDGAVKLRCTNFTRPNVDELRQRWKRGAQRPDPVRQEVISTRQPMLFSDAQNDGRIPEAGRNFFVRTLIRSTAVFPLVVKSEVLGILSLASFRPREFGATEVELLNGLAAQVATAVQGIQLYQELAESRSELQRLNEQLQQGMGIEHHLARTDTLTGIPNRRFIDETVETEVVRARRYGQNLSIVMADVDRLKLINDTYSHQAGDETLRFVAELARESCREVDVVGRYGGDEFVFVLPSTAVNEAATLAERFRQRLSERPSANRTGHPMRLSVSLGVAEWDGGSMNEPACLLDAADRAMYRAKEAGRNRTMLAEHDGVAA